MHAGEELPRARRHTASSALPPPLLTSLNTCTILLL